MTIRPNQERSTRCDQRLPARTGNGHAVADAYRPDVAIVASRAVYPTGVVTVYVY